jgi:hypothetical protein
VTVSPSQTAVGNIVQEAVGAVCGAGLIVTVNVLLPVPLAFVALMVPLNVPSAVGVPENNPVAVLKPTPGIDTVVAQPPGGMAWFAVIW